MTRLVKDWTPDLVSAGVVAPHRYTWDRADEPEGQSFEDWKKARPYNPGEIVFCERGLRDGTVSFEKVRIVNVWRERSHLGDMRERYRVQRATVEGLWSKSWEYRWPGHIQRGYKLAGLAPDVLA